MIFYRIELRSIDVVDGSFVDKMPTIRHRIESAHSRVMYFFYVRNVMYDFVRIISAVRSVPVHDCGPFLYTNLYGHYSCSMVSGETLSAPYPTFRIFPAV